MSRRTPVLKRKRTKTKMTLIKIALEYRTKKANKLEVTMTHSVAITTY